MNTNQLTLPLAILTSLCFGGCERGEEPDRPFVNDANEPGDNTAFPRGNQSATEIPKSPDPGASQNARGGPDAPAGGAPGYTVPKADPSPHDELAEVGGAPTDAPAQPGSDAADRPQTRAEFVQASRRRLAQMEAELQQLEGRSRTRGQQLRAEIREEKRRLDQQLERMDRESEEAWTDMKAGFADALGRLETQIRKVREDLDPES